MDRREFVKRAAGTLVLVPAMWKLEACGDDTTSSNGTDAGQTNAGTGASGTGSAGGGSGTGASGTGSSNVDASTALDASSSDDSGAVSGSDASVADSGLDSSVDSGAAVCPNGAEDTLITSNHGHSLTVPMADVVAGVSQSYSIAGPHVHMVTLSPANFATLAAGNTVMVTSTAGGVGPQQHTHEVTVACA